MIEALLAEPTGDELLDDPGAPAHLQGLARQDDADADGGHGDDDEGENRHRLPDGLRVARFERVEEPAVPVVERHGGAGRQDQERGEPQRQGPGAGCVRTTPEAAGEPAESADHPGIELEPRGVRGLEVLYCHGGGVPAARVAGCALLPLMLAVLLMS